MEVKKKKRSKKKVILIICIIIVLLAAGTGIFMKHKIDSKLSSASQTTTAVASTMDIKNTLTSDGEITSSLEEAKTPHTSYYLSEIKVEEGDSLKEGDTILTYTNGTTMVAPYNCVVENWYLPNEGKKLTSDHYVTIAGTDIMQMELSISEEDISSVKVGDSATVTVEATDGSYTGTVTSVSDVGTYSGGSSTFTAKVRFNNDGDLKLGMTGEAEITLDEADNVIGIPVNAVSTKNNESYVTVQSGDSTSEVEVETGVSNDSYIEIKSGLSTGDVVVVPVTEDSDDSQGMGDMQMPGGGEMPGGGSGGAMPGGGGMPGGGM